VILAVVMVVVMMVVVIRRRRVIIMTFAQATIMVFIPRLIFAMARRALLRTVVGVYAGLEER